jgi:hypothetical protein
MQNAEALNADQIGEFLEISREIEFTGQSRAEVYGWVERVLAAQEYAGQQSFRMKIASAVEHLVPKIPGKVWDRIAQMMLSALTVEDGGDEADLVGAARMYVERYLSETPFVEAEEDQPYQTRFKPAAAGRP